MKIVHFSDIHIGAFPEVPNAFFDKRCIGSANYIFRRRFQHNPEFVEGAVASIFSENPDIVICTGDLTSSSQVCEFDRALEFLAPLLSASVPLVYVPGNHDFYVKNVHCIEAMKSAVRILNGGRFSFEDMPFSFKFAGVEFIVVETARPTNVLSSCGYMSDESSCFIEDICGQPHDLPRVLINHFPILERHPLKRFRHRLYGQKRVAELINNKAIDISLCGHVHSPYHLTDESGRGEICAGSVTKHACMTVIEYNKAEDFFVSRQVSLR